MIRWHPDLSVHNHQIDAQHQEMFDLTNRMLQAQEPSEVRGLLMQLYKHTREHFEAEEAHMRATHYPDLAAHAASHNHLLGRLNEVSEAVGQGRMDKSAIEHLVLDWAVRHTGHDDARFAVFLNAGAD